MASWEPAAAPLQVTPAARPRLRAAPRASRTRPRTTGGIVWIAFLTLVLTGVVGMNVLVLRLNMRLDDLGRERANLRAENAQLQSQLSSSEAPAKIQALARAKLGVVPVAAGDTSYVDLAPHR